MKKYFFLASVVHLICLTSSGTTYTVTNTLDAGAGSLRQAMLDANAAFGTDVINFNIAGAAPYIITVTTALPMLTDNGGVIIDGTSQPGYAVNTNIPVLSGLGLNGTPVIVINNGNVIPVGINIQSSYNIIKGLVIQNFGDGTPSENDIGIFIHSTPPETTPAVTDESAAPK